MKIAIIGGGFAGLATAYFLLQSKGYNVQVTIFECKKIGGGASAVCSGLMHPYPGFSARRSDLVVESMQWSQKLFDFAQENTSKKVACYGGIFRQSMNEEQHQRLKTHCEKWKDIEQVEKNLFFIEKGITVHAKNYLEGLSRGIFALGCQLCIQKIYSLEELSNFDFIVIAAGYGIIEFAECKQMSVKFLKGQALLLKGKPLTNKSFISKGYLAYIQGEEHFTLGSTYEKTFTDDLPHLEQAKELLKEHLLKEYLQNEVLNCQAGVRVMGKKSYLPMIEKVAKNAYALTGFGSRGLLYHGLYGKKMAEIALQIGVT